MAFPGAGGVRGQLEQVRRASDAEWDAAAAMGQTSTFWTSGPPSTPRWTFDNAGFLVAGGEREVRRALVFPGHHGGGGGGGRLPKAEPSPPHHPVIIR